MSNLDEQRFLDSNGKVIQWPSKRSDQLLILAYLAGKFDHGVSYREPEVDAIIKEWHTFGDWPLLRRELFDRGFLDRNIDGTNYRLIAVPTALHGLVLVRPNVERDAPLGVKWLFGPAGRQTLRLMGVAVQNNRPSTLEEEKERVRGFIVSREQITWMMMCEREIIGAIWLDLEITEYISAPSAHIMIGELDARKRGMGSAAFAAIINRLEERGGDEYLYSRHLLYNDAVSKLFRKVGFEDYGEPYQDSDGLRWQNVRYKLRIAT